jgi:DNA repair protein RadC
MVCLDAKGKVINCKQLFRGRRQFRNVSVRKIVENRAQLQFHQRDHSPQPHQRDCHPLRGGQATTRRIEAALKAVDIVLADHIVVADDDFVSMADNGFFK